SVSFNDFGRALTLLIPASIHLLGTQVKHLRRLGSAQSWTMLAYSSCSLEHGPERIYRPSVSSRSSHSAGSAAMAFNYRGSDSAGGRDSEAIRVEQLRAELVGLLERRTGSDGRHETAIPELKLYRYSHPTEPANFLQEPAVYVVVQGRKQVVLGDETYVYDRSQYLAVSV